MTGSRSNTGPVKLAGTAVMAFLFGAIDGYADTRQAAPVTDQQVVAEVAFEPALGRVVPMEIELATVDGPSTLASLTDGRPFIVAMAWYSCRNLCGLALNGLADAVSEAGVAPGRDFEVIVLSMDSRETPADAAGAGLGLMQRYPGAGVAAGWHFTTAGEEVIARVSEAVGFRFVWDEDKQQFAHPAGIVMADTGGVVADYLAGVNFRAGDIEDMIAATRGNEPPVRGNPVLLLCYDYDPESGEYTFAIMKTLRIVAAILLIALAGYLAASIRRERKSRG